MLRIIVTLVTLALLVAASLAGLSKLMRLSDRELIGPSARYYYREFRHTYDRSGEADILLLGNSRALSSLSSKVIERETSMVTYHLGYRAANLFFSKLTLDTYLNTCRRKPRCCVLEVSWFSFAKCRTYFPEDTASAFMFKDTEVLRYVPEYPGIIRGATKWYLYGNFRTPPNLIADTAGPDYSVYLNKPVAGFDRSSMASVFPGFKAGLERDRLETLVDIITTCRREGIRLILYTAPEHPEYTRSQVDRRKIMNTIKDLARKYSVSYYDFTVLGDQWQDRFVPMLFDGEHLNNPDEFTRTFLEVSGLLPVKSRNQLFMMGVN